MGLGPPVPPAPPVPPPVPPPAPLPPPSVWHTTDGLKFAEVTTHNLIHSTDALTSSEELVTHTTDSKLLKQLATVHTTGTRLVNQFVEQRKRVYVDTQRAAVPTSSGTMDITAPGVGTPKAIIVIFYRSSGTTGSANEEDINTSYGFCDGTNQYANASWARTGFSTSGGSRWQSANYVGIWGASTTTPRLSFNSWITDGVRLNVTNTGNVTDLYVDVVFFGGDDVEAVVGNIQASGSVNTSTSITGASFQPELMFGSCAGLDMSVGTSSHAILTFGFAYDDPETDTILQAVMGRGTPSTGNQAAWMRRNDGICGQPFTTSPWYAEITSFNSDGVTITTRGAGAGSDFIGYLLLNLSGHNIKVNEVFGTPLTTGEHTLTTEFTPQSIIGAISRISVTSSEDPSTGFSLYNPGNTSNTGSANGEAFGHFLADTSGNEFYYQTQWDHNLNPGIAQTIRDTQILNLFSDLSDDSTPDFNVLAAASISSFSSSGTVFDFTTVSPSNHFVGWAIQFAAAENYKNHTTDALIAAEHALNHTTDANLQSITSTAHTTQALLRQFPLLEVGKALVDENWHTVPITIDGFTDPVVICAIEIPNSSHPPVVARVRNVTTTSFQLRMQHADSATTGINQGFAPTYIHYIILDAGVYTENTHGIKMEVVKYTSSTTYSNAISGGDSRSYTNSYTSPVVLGQIQTENDPDWSVFFSYGPTFGEVPSSSTLRVGKHVSKDTDTTRSNETIGYVVIEEGSGLWEDIEYSTSYTSEDIAGVGDSPPYQHDDASITSAFAAVASISTVNSTNGGWPVFIGSNPTTSGGVAPDNNIVLNDPGSGITLSDPYSGDSGIALNLAIDEFDNGERSHTAEAVAYIIFGSPVGYPYHWTNSLLTALRSSSHTSDALLYAEESLQHTTDAKLDVDLIEYSSVHTTDALLSEQSIITHTTDAKLLKQFSVTHTTDTLLQKQLSSTHTTNTKLLKQFSIIHSTDAKLLEQYGTTHTTDALLQATFSRTHSTDAKIALELAVSHTTNTLLQAEFGKAHTSDALLEAEFTNYHTTNAKLLDEDSFTQTTDALLKAEFSDFHTTDALLWAEQGNTHSTDSLLLAEFNESHVTDAKILAERSSIHTTDALLAAQRDNTYTTDAFLLYEGELSHTTDAKLEKAGASISFTDALLQAEQSSQHSTDSLIYIVSDESHTTDAKILLEQQATTSTDALLKGTSSLVHSVDALLQAEQSSTHSTDARKVKTEEAEQTTDALLYLDGVSVHTTDALLLAEQSANHSTDAFLSLRISLTHTTNAKLQAIFSGSGNLAFNELTIAGAGEVEGPGVGQISFTKFTLEGAGEFIPVYASEPSITLPNFGISGTGEFFVPFQLERDLAPVNFYNRRWLEKLWGWGSIDHSPTDFDCLGCGCNEIQETVSVSDLLPSSEEIAKEEARAQKAQFKAEKRKENRKADPLYIDPILAEPENEEIVQIPKISRSIDISITRIEKDPKPKQIDNNEQVQEVVANDVQKPQEPQEITRVEANTLESKVIPAHRKNNFNISIGNRQPRQQKQGKIKALSTKKKEVPTKNAVATPQAIKRIEVEEEPKQLTLKSRKSFHTGIR